MHQCIFKIQKYFYDSENRDKSREKHEHMKIQKPNELCTHAHLEIFIFQRLESFYDS